MTPTKPTPNDKGVLSYAEAMHYLQSKYHFNARDFYNDADHLDNWLAKKGYVVRGASIAQQQAWVREYDADPEGDAASQTPRDFWVWLLGLINKPGEPMKRLPKAMKLDIPKILKTYDSAVAPVSSAVQNMVFEELSSVINTVQQEFRAQILRQYTPTSALLPDLVKQILGYFHEEFGPVLKLDLPDF